MPTTAAEQFQFFPHGLVYASLGAMAVWLVLVVGVGIRTLWRLWHGHRAGAEVHFQSHTPIGSGPSAR